MNIEQESKYTEKLNLSNTKNFSIDCGGEITREQLNKFLGLITSKSIQKLKISNVNLQSNELIESIAIFLQDNTSLISLDLSETNINSTGLANIFRALEKNTRLAKLDLSKNPFDKLSNYEGFFKNNRTLQILLLEGTHVIPDKEIIKFIKACEGNVRLMYFSLTAKRLNEGHHEIMGIAGRYFEEFYAMPQGMPKYINQVCYTRTMINKEIKQQFYAFMSSQSYRMFGNNFYGLVNDEILSLLGVIGEYKITYKNHIEAETPQLISENKIIEMECKKRDKINRYCTRKLNSKWNFRGFDATKHLNFMQRSLGNQLKSFLPGFSSMSNRQKVITDQASTPVAVNTKFKSKLLKKFGLQ